MRHVKSHIAKDYDLHSVEVQGLLSNVSNSE